MAAPESDPYRDAVARIVREGEHPLPALFAFVQALPYRFPGPRDARHTLEHGWGTCAGKNYLLAELLQVAGVPVEHMIATGDLRESLGIGEPVRFPNPLRSGDAPPVPPLPALPLTLRAIAESGPLPDVHSFLTVRGPDGPVLVDASWDPPLAAHGFPVEPLPWDGCTDTVLAIRPHAVYAVTGPDQSAEKEEIRARLYRNRPSDKARRDHYLAELSAWMEQIRRVA